MNDEKHSVPPADENAHEPLGPATPDPESPGGSTSEVHREIIPEDLPKDHPGRKEAERQAEENDGIVTGNT